MQNAKFKLKTQRFTHLNRKGKAKMVDVSQKGVIRREAIARGEILLNPGTIRLIKDKNIPKGDVFTAAKIAGIMAAKKVGELIPLCHPLSIDWLDLDFKLEKDRVRIISRVKIEARTGVEMEALTAVAVAGLTIYDMCKAVDKRMVISNIKLEKKIKS
jgi:cyclic pyranopterin phosphate synthase